MNVMVLSILLAVVPSLLVLAGFLRNSSVRTRLVVVFISGYFAVLPSLAVELAFFPGAAFPEGLSGVLVHAFLVAGLVEESVKLVLITLFTRHAGSSSPRTLRISVAAAAGMGFAAFENLLYAGNEISTLLLRGVTAVPLHLATSVIMATIMNSGDSGGRSRRAHALLVAVLLHGFYDALLFLPPPLPFGVLPVVGVLVAVTVSSIRRAFRATSGSD